MPLTLSDDRLHDRKYYCSLDASQRELCRVEIRDNKLFWAHNHEPVSTTGFVGKSTRINKVVAGLAAYAVDEQGVLYIYEHRSELSHPQGKPGEFFSHASFFDGGPGMCFGMIQVEEGVIKYIDNESGHYLPSPKDLDDFLLTIPTNAACKIVRIQMDSDSDSDCEPPTTPKVASALCQLGITVGRPVTQPQSLSRTESDSSIIDHGDPNPAP